MRPETIEEFLKVWQQLADETEQDLIQHDKRLNATQKANMRDIRERALERVARYQRLRERAAA